MERIKLKFAIFLLFINLISYSQDVIIKRDDSRILCKITKENTDSVFYQLLDGKQIISINKLELKNYLYSADVPVSKNEIKKDTAKSGGKEKPKIEFDKVSVGLGAGLDYGGLLGVHLLAYPTRNVGIFGGAGYALIGFAYNAGVKLRHIPKNKQFVRFNPFLMGMYGYNTVIEVTNAEQYNKIFYGATFGFGVDIRMSNGCWSFAILMPIRGSEVDNYMNSIPNVRIIQDLSPVAFSVGYNFMMKY